MKWLLITALFAGTLAIAFAATCESNDDCRDNFCCRAVTGAQLRKRGVCIRKATIRRRCSEDDEVSKAYGKYMSYCPCADNLECKPRNAKLDKKTDLAKYLEDLRCQKKTGADDGGKEENKEDKDKDKEGNKDNKDEEEKKKKEEEEKKKKEEEEAKKKKEEEDANKLKEKEKQVVDEAETHGAHPKGNQDAILGPGGEPPRDDDCLDWEYPC